MLTRPERHNAVKVLLFLDVGGSMEPHVRVVEELFSAARAEFKHLEYFYFHNCLYEGVWRDNRRRWDAPTPTGGAPDLRPRLPGDLRRRRGDVALRDRLARRRLRALERREPGATWLARVLAPWPHAVWMNPTPEAAWGYTPSVGMLAALFGAVCTR